jgi:hypothetical protein
MSLLLGFGRHLRRNAVGYVALFVALSGTAVAAGPAIKGDITQLIAGSGVTVSPAGDQSGPVTVGLQPCANGEVLKSSAVGYACGADNTGLPLNGKAADSDLLDGMDSAAFATGSGSAISRKVVGSGVSSFVTVPGFIGQVGVICVADVEDGVMLPRLRITPPAAEVTLTIANPVTLQSGTSRPAGASLIDVVKEGTWIIWADQASTASAFTILYQGWAPTASRACTAQMTILSP